MDHLKRFAAELFGTFTLCAIAMLDFSTLWMYAVGPLAGAAVAGLVARVFLVDSSESAARCG
jgi:glycerol uptake facilitator-like aquaporin